jgi:hypothetical protein
LNANIGASSRLVFFTDGFDTVDVAPPFMSSNENNTQGARRDGQRTRLLSRENIVKMLKTTIVLSALFLSIWAVVLNHSVEALEPTAEEESAILVETEGREADVYCPEGGADIFLGTDFDGDGKLSASEITTSTKVCHGQQGLSGPQGQTGMNGENGFNGNSSLVNLTAISPGIPCQFGGIQIQSGIDLDHNSWMKMRFKQLHMFAMDYSVRKGLKANKELMELRDTQPSSIDEQHQAQFVHKES